MKEILEAIALANNFPFEYSRHDYRNLFDEIEQENISHIFLDPVKITDNDNDEGVTESKTYEGFFLVVFSSSIDEGDYEARFDKYIKPIVTGDLKTIKHEIRCGNKTTFNIWRYTEVINMLDYNFDGLMVDYNVTIEE